jgi:galactoside 2-L-fucosyltransferase 1/2
MLFAYIYFPPLMSTETNDAPILWWNQQKPGSPAINDKDQERVIVIDFRAAQQGGKLKVLRASAKANKAVSSKTGTYLTSTAADTNKFEKNAADAESPINYTAAARRLNLSSEFATLGHHARRNSNTIVTAYFPTGTVKNSQEQYIKWMGNMLSLSDPMVIFTTEEMIETVLKLRAPSSQTRVVAMTIEDTLMAQMYDVEFWQKQYDMDPEGGPGRPHSSFELYLIWNEKFHFLKRVSDWNPFESDFFAWVDIGYFRTTKFNHQIMLDRIPTCLERDQVLVLDISSLDKKHRVGGGFVGGHAVGIQHWHHHYYDTFAKMNQQNLFVGKEQNIMDATCANTSGLCQFVIPDIYDDNNNNSHGDLWFFMAPYLNNVTAPRLQARRFIRIERNRGRLGNQMFEWASTLGIAAANDNIIPCMGPDKTQILPDLLTTFEGPFPQCRGPPSRNLKTINEQGNFARFNEFAQLQEYEYQAPAATDILLVKSYLQSFKYFEAIKEDIQSIFRVKEDILERVKPFLQSLDKRILVGIHVRRGDMTQQAYMKAPLVEFYAKAIKYFRNKYDRNNLMFLVVSDDQIWCRDQDVFRDQPDIVFLPGKEPSEDMASLMECQHLVISAGTFGWWAAWLGPYSRGGEVVFFSGHFRVSSKKQGEVDEAVYFPADWIPMGDSPVFPSLIEPVPSTMIEGNISTTMFPMNPRARIAHIHGCASVAFDMFVHSPDIDHISESLLGAGGASHWDCDIITDILKVLGAKPDGDNSYFLDIGSNVGTFSLTVAHSGFKVVAFDAMSFNVELQKASIGTSGVDHLVHLFHTAVSNVTGPDMCKTQQSRLLIAAHT